MPNVLWPVKFVFVVSMLLSLTACSSEDADVASSDTQSVDSRFASAEALIDYYNSFATIDPINFRNYLDILYAENNLQKRMIAHYKAALPVLDLSTAVRQRFNESLIPESNNYSTLPILKPARLIKHSGERTEAIYTDFDGQEGRLHLVMLDERWWVSGYTLEYDMFEDTDPQSMIEGEQYTSLYAAVAPDLMRRINNDDFASIEQFRDAFREAMGEEIRRNPENYRILFTDD